MIWAMSGILAGVSDSIPYFGPVIVSGGLLVVGLAQGGDLAQALLMSGMALLIASREGWWWTTLRGSHESGGRWRDEVLRRRAPASPK
jgi:hypothetical protein